MFRVERETKARGNMPSEFMTESEQISYSGPARPWDLAVRYRRNDTESFGCRERRTFARVMIATGQSAKIASTVSRVGGAASSLLSPDGCCHSTDPFIRSE